LLKTAGNPETITAVNKVDSGKAGHAVCLSLASLAGGIVLRNQTGSLGIQRTSGANKHEKTNSYENESVNNAESAGVRLACIAGRRPSSAIAFQNQILRRRRVHERLGDWPAVHRDTGRKSLDEHER
jgi:hypothetical protein